MIPLVEPGPGCALQVEEMEVVAQGAGWLETTRLEVAGSPGCPWVDLVLPSNAILVAHSGRTRLGDGGGRRIAVERYERIGRDLSGRGALRVHLPELIQGDQAVLEVTRRWEGGLTWAPASHGARFARLTGAPSAATGLAEDEGGWWAAPPGPDTVARFGEPPATHALPLAAPPAVTESLRLDVPGGNPQLTLYPGGGASTRIERRLTFAPHPDDRGWIVALGTAATKLAWTARPEGAARVVRVEDSARIELAGSESAAVVSLAWTVPDAPTFGEGDADLRVAGDGAEIAWDEVGDRRLWRITAWSGEPILPDRAAYVRALDRRFAGANLPGVGLPTELRGRTPDATFAEDALQTFKQRYGIGRWPHDPTWPRRLVRARRTLAFTPTEAALVLVGWLEQGGLPAEWALTRPLSAGPPGAASPAGFVRALVLVSLPEGPAWMDPSCSECGPWEIHPSAVGPAIGPAWLGPSGGSLAETAETPLAPGRWEVEVGESEVTWTLEGSAAIALREWLARLAPGARESALGGRVAGAAEVTGAEGVADPGGPIRITARGVPPHDPVSQRNLGWVGTRVVRRPAAGAPPDASLETAELSWTRGTTAGITTEIVTVHTPSVATSTWESLDRARIGPTESRTMNELDDAPVPEPALVIP